MALCTRCGRHAEPGAEFCQGCAGNPAAEAADQPTTAPAMVAAADYLRPFAAQGMGPGLLPEVQGREYWTDPGMDRIPVYQEAAWAVPSPSGDPSDLAQPPGGDQFGGGRSYTAPEEHGPAVVPPYEDYNPGTGNVSPPGATYVPAPGQAFTVAGERYAPTASPRGKLQPYGPADAPYAADDERYPIPDAPYEAGQQDDPLPEPSYSGDQDLRGTPGPAYVADQPYQAAEPYPAANSQWGAVPRQDAVGPREDLTGLDPFGYQDPWPSPPAALPAGLGDSAAAPSPSDPALSDAEPEAGRGWGAGARRFFGRRAAEYAEPDDDELQSEAMPGQLYTAPPHIPDRGPAVAMAPPDGGRFGPVAAGTGPSGAQARVLTDEPMLAVGSEAGRRAGLTSVLTAGRPPQPGRWIAFAAAAVVLIIAAGSAAILLAHHSPPARHPAAGRPAVSRTAPSPKPASTPLVTVLPAAASASQAPVVEAFVAAYFTAINEHDFAAYQALFGRTLRAGLSATAFARGYGSSQDSRATLHRIAVSADGQVVAMVSFVSHQQPTDSATHSSCTVWTISLYLAKHASSYVIQAPPAGYGATAAACS